MAKNMISENAKDSVSAGGKYVVDDTDVLPLEYVVVKETLFAK